MSDDRTAEEKQGWEEWHANLSPQAQKAENEIRRQCLENEKRKEQQTALATRRAEEDERIRQYLLTMRDLMEQTQQAARQARAAADEAGKQAVHGIDFRCVNWFGTEYTFTKGQAPIVKMLWEHWQQGTPEVGDDALLDADDPEDEASRERVKFGATKLSQVFRHSPAWRAIIVPGKTRKSYRLAEPAKKPAKKAEFEKKANTPKLRP